MPVGQDDAWVIVLFLKKVADYRYLAQLCADSYIEDPMTHPPLYLLRHGQTDWNRDGRIQGQMESDLTETGRGHASRQGEILSGLGLPVDVRAICSPQRRTRQTAELALAPIGLAPMFDDRLKEIYMGDWEGHLYADMRARQPEFFDARSTFDVIIDSPGETYDDMAARLSAFVAELDAPSVIISHGIALTFLRGTILGSTREEMRDMKREQGVVIEVRDGIETVHR